MKLDRGFFGRAAQMRDDAHKDALLAALLAIPGLTASTDRAAMTATVEKIWQDVAVLDLRTPLSKQKYTLMYLTQVRWMKNPTHLAYAARMIGTPDQNWRIESGIAAVYANVVAPHYLAEPLIAFIAKEEAASR